MCVPQIILKGSGGSKVGFKLNVCSAKFFNNLFINFFLQYCLFGSAGGTLTTGLEDCKFRYHIWDLCSESRLIFQCNTGEVLHSKRHGFYLSIFRWAKNVPMT